MQNRTRGIIAAAAALVLLLGVGAWYFLFRDTAPAEVDLDAATEQVAEYRGSDTDGGAAGDGDGGAADPGEAANGGISGTWTVDTGSGSFDFESATGSFAGFRVQEELVGLGTTEAVGRTGEVSGTVVIEGTLLESTEVEVDMASITTNIPRRDGRVLAALEVEQYPSATFVLAEPVELGDGAARGEPVSVAAQGQMTIHGVTRDVTAALEAQLVDGTAVVVGTVPFTFEDYDVEKPSAGSVISVADDATVEFQLLFTPA